MSESEEILTLREMAESDPARAVDEVDRLLTYVEEGSPEERATAASTVRRLADAVPRETSSHFESILRCAPDAEGDVRLSLFRAADALRTHVRDERIWEHRDALLAAFDADRTDVREAVAGLVHHVARYDPAAVAPYVDSAAELLDADAPETVLAVLDEVAGHDAEAVAEHTDAVFAVVEDASAVPSVEYFPSDANVERALSVLVCVSSGTPDRIDHRRLTGTLRSLATTGSGYIRQRATEEAGLLIADRPAVAEDLIDVLVENLGDDDRHTRRQAAVECLRLATVRPDAFGAVDAASVADRVEELDVGLHDEFDSVPERIERIRAAGE